jgi:ribosomal protein S18 acetylase RimI-like enzyme
MVSVISSQTSPITIRQAQAYDIQVIWSFDHIAQDDEPRRVFIRHAVLTGQCSVAIAGQEIIGYAVLEYSFYAYGFIAMVYIHPDHRHAGAGSALIRYLESLCQTEKLFTSTNASNLPMQALLTKLGYVRSGMIENLDEDDPELVYFKKLAKK